MQRSPNIGINRCAYKHIIINIIKQVEHNCCYFLYKYEYILCSMLSIYALRSCIVSL